MKDLILSIIVVIAIVIQSCGVQTDVKKEADSMKFEPQIAVQMWSLREHTFCEALDMLKGINVQYIEAYKKQKIGGGMEGFTLYTMTAEQMDFIKDTLQKAGIKMIQYGVVSGKDSSDWVQIFEFGRAMGIEVFTSEPQFEEMQLVEDLAMAYDIKVAIHNHPTPSRYWHPDSVLKAIDGKCMHHIGACVDNGHWTRSQVGRIRGLKKLEGRVKAIHLKDLNLADTLAAHTVVIGTGVNDVAAILTELKNQAYTGIITVEYEHNWENNIEEIKQSVAYIRKTLSEI